MICVPSYYALDVPGLPWISIRRLALLAMIVPFAVALGGSSRLRGEIWSKLANERAISVCLSGFYLWCWLSLPFSHLPAQSLTSNIDDFLTYYLPLFLCLYLLATVAKVERLAEVLCWYSILLVMLGITEFILRRRFYFDIMPKWYLNALMEANPSVFAMVTTSPFRNGQYRASSIFTIPITFGEFEMMMAPLGWYFLVHGEGARRRLLGLAVAVSTLIGIFVSGSRGAYVGTLAALGAFVSLWIVRNARRNPNSLTTPFAIVMAAVSAVAIIGVITVSGRVHGMIFGNSANDQASTDARWMQWDLLKPHLWESPIFGHGRQMAGDVIGYFPPGAYDSFRRQLHPNVACRRRHSRDAFLLRDYFIQYLDSVAKISSRFVSRRGDGRRPLLFDRRVRRLPDHAIGAGQLFPVLRAGGVHHGFDRGSSGLRQTEVPHQSRQ